MESLLHIYAKISDYLYHEYMCICTHTCYMEYEQSLQAIDFSHLLRSGAVLCTGRCEAGGIVTSSPGHQQTAGRSRDDLAAKDGGAPRLVRNHGWANS